MNGLKNVQFPGKHPDEVVILLQRRHSALLIGRMFRWIILALLPGLIQLVLNIIGTNYSFDPQTSSGVLLTLGGSLYLLIVLLLAFHDFIDFYLDVLLLTNERVIRVDQKGMFDRVVSQLALDRIQDVTCETKGVLSTMFGFGKVTIESAGEQENFIFDNIPQAERIQATILQYARQAPRMGIEKSEKSNPKSPTNTPS